MTIHEMQNLNRTTIEYASSIIVPDMTLVELRMLCEEYMLSHGADSFWYWDVGAFVFSGDRTAVSVSGQEYKTDNSKIKQNDIITIDLSPQRGGIWGDYARTLVINTETTFEELFYYVNDQIKLCGYVNLDFLGNLGHSIVKDKKDRIYIEKGNKEKLSNVEAFTFEPHISLPKSLYGFKMENIYAFHNNKLIEL